MPFKMFFAGKALSAICTENHGDTTSSASETVLITRVEGCVCVDDEDEEQAPERIETLMNAAIGVV